MGHRGVQGQQPTRCAAFATLLGMQVDPHIVCWLRARDPANLCKDLLRSKHAVVFRRIKS